MGGAVGDGTERAGGASGPAPAEGGIDGLVVGEGTVAAQTRRITRERAGTADAGPPEAPWRGTFLGALRDAVKRFAERPALRSRRSGKWETITFDAVWKRAAELAMGLRAAGVTKDDRVLIIAENSAEAVYAELATFACRALSVVLHPRFAPSVLREITNQVQPRVAIVESGQALARYLEARADAQDRVKVISFGDGIPGPRGEIRGLSAILADGRRRLERCRVEGTGDPFEQLVDRTRPTDAIAIAYTSGTTGAPRGAVFGHENILAGDLPLLFGPPSPEDVALIQMPLASPFARMTVAYQLLLAGGSVAFSGVDARLIEALAAHEPTMLFLSSGTLEPLEIEIKRNVREQTHVGRRLTDWALRRAREARTEGGGRPPWIVDKLILSRIRQYLGGRIRLVYIGGAADGDVLSFFQDAGIDTYEGYGVTEATPLVALSRPDGSEASRYGDGVVGRPLPGVAVTTDDDGEILASGLVNMRGYWKDDAASAEALLPDGRLRTGDLGYLDPSGQIVLQDKKGHVLRLADGSIVAPAPVELALRAGSSLVKQITLVGQGRPFLVALVLPDWRELAARVYRAQPDLAKSATKKQLLSNPASRVTVEIEVLTKALSLPFAAARPKKIRLIAMGFSTAYELSPSGALRRDAIEDRYRTMIDQLYAEAAADEAAMTAAVAGGRIESCGEETMEMRKPAF